MTRDIASGTVTKLEANSIFYAELIQLHLRTTGSDLLVQYTSANADLEVATSTSSENTYVSQGQFINFGNLKETADMQIQSFDLTFTAVDTTTLAALIASDTSDRALNGRRVVVHRVILDAEYKHTSDDVYMIFDGLINGFSLAEDENTATVNLNCSSRFVNFDATAGRKTTVGSQQIYFPQDRGFEFASSLKKDVRWGQA